MVVAAIAGGGLAGLGGGVSTASAEVGAPAATVQAIAADAQFLEYAPPPAAPGVVCLIDSGVDPNPDTTPILAASYATQAGTDTADELSKLMPPLQPGGHPDGHGTYMAMIMAAPVNDWGMVGIAPTSVKVYNVKVLGAEQSTFTFPEYANAIEHCVDAPVGVLGLSVVNLSLGSADQPSQSDAAALAFAVADARNRGLDVVGAAGNSGGAVAFPAATSGVLAVGSTDANPSNLGVFCTSSGRGSELGLLAPGCGTQTEVDGGGNGIDAAFSDDGSPAWASGTSEAAAVVSAVLASMRAYDPRLTAAQAEGCLITTAIRGGNVDVAAGFRECGLGTVVSEGSAAYQAAIATPPPVTQPVSRPPSTPAPAQQAERPTEPVLRLTPRPRVLSVVSRRSRLAIAVASVPSGDTVHVNVDWKAPDGRYRVVASKTSRKRLVSIAARRWDRIRVFFVKGDIRSDVLTVDRDSKLAMASARRAMRGRGAP
jgi:Subtilase family